MFVKAATGLQVPKEGKPRDYLTEQLIEEVADTAYYVRRVADGDLLECTQKEFDTQQAKLAKAAAADAKTV